MKKHLRLFCVTLLLVACGTMWAGEESITFSEKGYLNGRDLPHPISCTNFSLNFDKGTGKTVPSYYNDGQSIRLYSGGTLTVASKEGLKITKIVFVFGSGGNTNAISVDGGEYSSGTWSGEATKVVFTVGGTKGHRRFASVTVTYVADAAPESISVSIGKVGYSTLYYSDRSLEVPEGVKAYTVTVDGSRINLAETGSIVPAGEAVVLKGAAGEHVFNVSNATVEKAAANLLKGCDEATAVSEEGYKYYMLATKNGQNLGFYYEVAGGATINCKAHKAYLPIPSDAPAAAKSFFPIDDSTTAITLGTADEAEQAFFNLAGQRVESPRRGLYVVKGKKVLLK